ncbi:hypothetical protein HET69_28100 [Streptomyces sp. CJ_13]|uniref:hypothetical protein n=1 Tax=Streptomyces sp. CJ_13 TaxID=2724943 RepID=UPI001BDC4E82|nr:hypothetical protein [Streptomyces sp. CJ_13]MBT1187749.1 hypothetical protein [Streptomyces sp. CJ_13]
MRITLTGEPGPDELAELTRRLTALVAGRLAQAEREVGRVRPAAWADGAPAREVHEPGRDVVGGYAVPSYGDAGRPAKVPVRGKEPWTVVGTARPRIEVGWFLRYVEEMLGQPFPEAVLYRSLGGTVRDVDVWLVRLNKAYVPHTLGEELVVRSSVREKGRQTVPAWAVAGADASLHRLTAADESGTIAARVPRVPPGHIVFAAMRLPRVGIGDVAALGPGLLVGMTVREAGFCVDEAVFERATGIPWSRYAEEYAREIVTVWLQPAVLRPASNPVRTPAGIDRDALFLLLDRHAGDHPARHEPAARLFVAEGDVFPGVPGVALRHLEWPAEEGERVLYCRASFDLAPELLDAAYFRPTARRMAAGLVPLIGEDGFAAALGALLDESGQHVRGRFGSLFGYVLESVERHGKLAEFFDAADATRRFALRLRLLQQCESSPYAQHERVRALRAALARERAATSAHAYAVGGLGQGAVRLDRRPDGTVLAGEVLGRVDFLYEKSSTVMRPKPGRAEALRAELLAQRERLVEDILSGRDQRVYSEGEFAATAVERAARAGRITADDFEEVEVEFGIRLLEVLATQEQGLPSYAVRFEFVSRVAGRGEQWGRAAGPLLEPVGEFEARLVQWRLGRAGEGYRIAGFAVLAIGGLALAWEAGVVASLIRLGGGIGAVGFGVGVSEGIHLVKVLLHEEEATAGGFVMAAVDGYLGAVGYKIGGGLGGLVGGRIGTASLRARIASVIAGKLVTGVVGGSTAAALATFAHDVVGARWSGIDAYVQKMEFGVVVGVVGAFTVEPFLHGLLTRAGPTLVKAALLTRLLSGEGVTAERWAEAMALTRRQMERTLGQSLPAAEARAWTRALGERVDEAAEGLAHAQVRPRGTASRVPARIEEGHETPAPARAPGRAVEAARPGPAAAWPSWAQLKRASLTDREAALDRRWYETARPEELRAREAHDPVAKEFLDEQWGGPTRPYQPERPADPAVQQQLRQDLGAARAAVEAERRRLEAAGLREPSSREPSGFEERATLAGGQDVPPTAKAAAGYEGTVAVARSDIPALAGELFTGGSPRALGSYDPAHDIRPPDNVVVPRAHGHAEQDLGQQLDARLARLTEAERAAAHGRTVYIRVDQEVCSICAAALGGGPRAGVLSRLSARHSDIVFEVTADDVSTVYRVIAGRRVR